MAAQAPLAPSPRRGRWQSLAPWLGMPLFLLAVGSVLAIYLSTQEFDSIEKRTLNFPDIYDRVMEHVQLTAISTVIVIGLAVPLGIVATRRATRALAPAILALANLGQSIPSFGLMTLIVLWLGVGFRSIVIGLFAYSILPILRNTMVGLQQVDRTLIKAARGMGMSPWQTLLRVELPLAVPVILAGIRTALIINVGTATLAIFFGGEALGYVIFQGIQLNRTPVLITGAVLASGLALLIDYLASIAERLLTPKGL